MSGHPFGCDCVECDHKLAHRDLFDPPTGAELRDDGMDRAVKHADRVERTWSECAYTFLLEYARRCGSFTAEDVRKDAEANGVTAPPDPRAWGGIMMRAARANVIVSTGRYTKASAVHAHCGPKAVWHSLVAG